MRYVSEIIDDIFGFVYYSSIEDLSGFSITDTETGKTIKYNMQGTESLITKELLLEFSETVYGFDIVNGLWLIRPCDLALYDIIECTDKYEDDTYCMFNLNTPIDESETLMLNKSFSGENNIFTIASIIYEMNNFRFKNTGVVRLKNDIIKIKFRSEKVVFSYKIIDMRKFRILMTKYQTLRGRYVVR